MLNFYDVIPRLHSLHRGQPFATATADVNNLDSNERSYPVFGQGSGGCARLRRAHRKIRRARQAIIRLSARLNAPVLFDCTLRSRSCLWRQSDWMTAMFEYSPALLKGVAQVGYVGIGPPGFNQTRGDFGTVVEQAFRLRHQTAPRGSYEMACAMSGEGECPGTRHDIADAARMGSLWAHRCLFRKNTTKSMMESSLISGCFVRCPKTCECKLAWDKEITLLDESARSVSCVSRSQVSLPRRSQH